MERGVVVGGLMICGSFLLAALLNRSAMEEVATPDAPAGTAPVAPRPPDGNEASAFRCANSDAPADPSNSPEHADKPRADTPGTAIEALPGTSTDDLMVNGIQSCSQ